MKTHSPGIMLTGLALLTIARVDGSMVREVGRELTPAVAQSSCPKAGPYTGTLCASLGAINANAFFSVVNHARFDSEDAVGESFRKLECDETGPFCNPASGNFPRRSVMLSIRPAIDAHKVDPDLVTANGTVVARITHYNKATWKRAGLPYPTDVVNINWYVVLVDDGSPNNQARVVYVRQSRNGNRIETVPGGTFVQCGEHVNTAYAEARFARCEVPPATLARELGVQLPPARDAADARRHGPRVFRPLMPDDGIWLRCAEGCCATQF